MIRKRVLQLSLCTFLAGATSAQQLYFPAQRIADSSSMVTAVPELARQVMAVYKADSGPGVYLQHLFRLQMAANEYDSAIVSINKLRSLITVADSRYPALSAIQFELFCRSKIKDEQKQMSFDEAFKKYFGEAFSKMDDKTALFISTAFVTRNGIAGLKAGLASSLAKQAGKDSISIIDAIALCENYNIVKVYGAMEPLARPLRIEDNQNRYVVQDSILIKTRDGASISAIVVHPKGITKPLPTILQFTIYTGAITDITRDDVAHGYVGMIAFTRGKRFSTDEIVPYEHDGSDCYDVIDWISKQPWSDGRVGMYGGSYNGFTQWAAAKHLHPALKTIVPSAAVAPGLDIPMMNNVFENFIFPWIYYVSNNKFLDFDDYNNYTKWDSLSSNWYSLGKPYKTMDSLTGRGKNRIFQSWIAHPDYDGFWQKMTSFKNDFEKINIPVLSTTGYFDGAQVSALYYFRQHYEYDKSANHFLIIGPYGHFGCQGFVGIPPDSVYEGYQIDPVANIPIHEIIFQWFDYIFKNGKKPEILKDKINYETMGANEWRHVPSFDKMNNDTIKLYLSNQSSEQYHLLTPVRPAKLEFLLETTDFSDRTTSNTFDHTDSIIHKVLDESNGFAFISDPVKKEMSINGCFTGEIKASINKKDMDYNITLYELMPDGQYFFLSYFMGRASYAYDHCKRQLLIPGKVETLPYSNSYMTSRKITPGSRLAVAVSVNKSRDNQINYGTGKEVSEESIEDAKEPLEVKWYNSSFICIPVWK